MIDSPDVGDRPSELPAEWRLSLEWELFKWWCNAKTACIEASRPEEPIDPMESLGTVAPCTKLATPSLLASSASALLLQSTVRFTYSKT